MNPLEASEQDLPVVDMPHLDDTWVVISEREADEYYSVNGIPYDRVHGDRLCKRLATQDRIIVELGPCKFYSEIKNEDIPQSSKVLVDLSKRHFSERHIWLENVDNDMFRHYKWQVDHPRQKELLACHDHWIQLVQLACTAMRLEDPVVAQQAIAGMRCKAEFAEHRIEHMFKSDELEFAYSHSPPGCALRSTLIDLATGTRGLIQSLSGPAEFLEEVDAVMQKLKEEWTSLSEPESTACTASIGFP